MKTGSSRPFRRPALIVVALFTALALVALAGCADSSPVAAPTSTLPEQPGDGAAADPAEVDIPEYETELDLTAAEEEAVDGALEAFVGYIATINRVFSSGGKDTSKANIFARDGSLESINSEAEEMRASNTYMAGEYNAYDVRVESVSIDEATPERSKVSVLFCTKDSEWQVVPAGEALPSSEPRGLTMQYEITFADAEWKVANQHLRSKQCGSV
jgi:type IV pilus biogenesis protein CpaD/CtpE